MRHTARRALPIPLQKHTSGMRPHSHPFTLASGPFTQQAVCLQASSISADGDPTSSYSLLCTPDMLRARLGALSAQSVFSITLLNHSLAQVWPCKTSCARTLQGGGGRWRRE